MWRTAVTPRNCQTGEAILTFSGLFMFNQGDTMSGYRIPPGSSPALRGPGHGVWEREHGWWDYWFAFSRYRYNATGVLIASQEGTAAALELAARGDHFALSADRGLDVNDDVRGTGCATGVTSIVGLRFLRVIGRV